MQRLILVIVSLTTGTIFAQTPVKRYDFGPLSEARQRLHRGNFEEARAAFEQVAAAHPRLAPAAVIGIARSHREVGAYDQALAVFNKAQQAKPNDPDLLAAHADLLYELGCWDEAESMAREALTKHDAQLLARWTLARILRDRGQVEDADKAIRWIVRYYSSRDNADDPITHPDELVIVAEAGAENARWHSLSKQFSFILNEVLDDALKGDPDLWPAEVLAGRMLLEKYNRPDAVDAFDKALKIYPGCVDALVGKAQAALQQYDIKEVETYVEQALRRNPRHREALRLHADMDLIAGNMTSAERYLRAAQAVNPRDVVTLGRLAAVLILQGRDADAEQLAADASAFDSKPGAFYLAMASVLDERKWYSRAEGYYRKAAELRPVLADARSGLGLLYLRMGNEQAGRDVLTQALERDPFNVRVSNSLKVLRHLDKYDTITTDHYILRYDPTKDRLLAKFLADYLEETHAELKRQFDYEPPDKILVEVFSTHEMFSGRTVGLPDLHTIGACTGRVVAMASPTAKGVSKPFNWGRVIRHELTHVFNLTQTEFRCPHWLTEGLAVRNEDMARPLNWTQILRDRMAKNELFTLDTVMMGFVRPKGPDEWTLAYCQSQLYVEYLIHAHGEACIRKLLEAYRNGQDTNAALQTACGVDQSAVETGYRAYLDNLLKAYGGSAKPSQDEKPMTFAELEAAHQAMPEDPELSARLAEALLKRNKFSEARRLADLALTNRPDHPVAAIVKSRLLVRAGDAAAARDVLTTARAAHPDDPRLIRELGRLAIEAKDYAAAAELYEHGRKVAPLDGDWLEQLARLYRLIGDTQKLTSVLQEIVSADPDEFDGRIKLARAQLAMAQPEQAEKLARDALRIDVMNPEAQTTLLEALRRQGKHAEAETLQKRFSESDVILNR